MTKLTDAVRANDIEAVKELLRAGTDINEKDMLGQTPLTSAVNASFKKMAQLLIGHGADVNKKTDMAGLTPLMQAAFRGDMEMASVLLDNGADINAKSKFGGSALMIAVENSYMDFARMLVVNGAEDDEDRPLRHPEIAKALEERRQLAERSERDRTEKLIDAVKVNNIEAVGNLLDNGADVNARNGLQQTALMWAAGRGHVAMACLLIGHGADVNEASGKAGVTALMWAAANGNMEMLHLLVEQGADPFAKDEEGMTAQNRAEDCQHAEAVLWLKKTADKMKAHRQSASAAQKRQRMKEKARGRPKPGGQA